MMTNMNTMMIMKINMKNWKNNGPMKKMTRMTRTPMMRTNMTKTLMTTMKVSYSCKMM